MWFPVNFFLRSWILCSYSSSYTVGTWRGFTIIGGIIIEVYWIYVDWLRFIDVTIIICAIYILVRSINWSWSWISEAEIRFISIGRGSQSLETWLLKFIEFMLMDCDSFTSLLLSTVFVSCSEVWIKVLLIFYYDI